MVMIMFIRLWGIVDCSGSQWINSKGPYTF